MLKPLASLFFSEPSHLSTPNPPPLLTTSSSATGHIIDGTGSRWYSGDIGIRTGRIAVIGILGNASAKRTIDAHGMVIAPGFIDMLCQSELAILVNRICLPKPFRASPPSSLAKAGRLCRSMTPSSRPTSLPMTT